MSRTRRLHSALALLLLPLSLAASEPLDADRILGRSEKTLLGETARYRLQMSVLRPGKRERVVEMTGWKKGDGLGLVRYTAPPRERGTAYLRNGDSNWLYLPSAGKVVRVGAKQNFGGGDFSNGDVFRLSLTRDYAAALAGEETVEGVACYRLELKARDRSVAYDRVLYWARSDGSFFPVKAEYYTLSGKRLKWLRASEVKPLGGRERPTLLTMESAVEPGARTLIQFLEIEDGVKLDDARFAPSALEHGE
jgi:outer membrane lipoprotein-sorting protein